MADTLVGIGFPEAWTDLGGGTHAPHCYTNFNGTVVSSPTPRNTTFQTYVLKIPNGGGGARPAQTFTIGANYCTFGWGFETANLTDDTQYRILEFWTGAAEDFSIRVNGSVLEVRDVAGTLLGSSASGTIAENTAIYIEIQFNSNASGDIILRVDGTEKINLTGVDLRGTGTGASQFRHVNDANAAFITNTYTDGYRFTTNPTKTNDSFKGNLAGRAYQNNLASTTHKFGTSPTSGAFEDMGETPGGTTNIAVWAGTGGNPLLSQASNTGVTCSVGSRPGPRNDTVVAGATFVGGVAALYAKRTGTFGPTDTVKLRIGQQASGSETTANTKAIGSALTLSTSYQSLAAIFDTFISSEAYNEDEWAQTAFDLDPNITEEDTARTNTISDIWSVYGYVPVAAAGRRVCVDGMVLTV